VVFPNTRAPVRKTDLNPKIFFKKKRIDNLQIFFQKSFETKKAFPGFF